MRNRWMLFTMALLGVFSSGRLGDTQDAGAPQTGPAAARENLPPIDAALPVKTQTATFALG